MLLNLPLVEIKQKFSSLLITHFSVTVSERIWYHISEILTPFLSPVYADSIKRVSYIDTGKRLPWKWLLNTRVLVKTFLVEVNLHESGF